MKSLTVSALLILLSVGAWMLPHEASAQQLSVSFRLFYDELSPYGMWVDYPNYGYVWMPDADPDFSPYASAGHWVFTEDGWTWVSDYPWGWAPFHYGRWDYDEVYGWFWVPDDVWGPAWVSWRRSPGYYGWAPLRPGISLSIAFGRDFRERNERWIFVRDRDFTRDDIDRRYVNRTNNVRIIDNSTVIMNTRKDDRRNVTYTTGPDRTDVQRLTRTTVNPVVIRDMNQPGYRLNKNELQIYRPQVQGRRGNGQDPAPSKVLRLNEVRPAAERNAARGRQQQPSVAPPNKNQPTPPGYVNPADRKRVEQRAPAVNPPNKNQPTQPRNVNPADRKKMEQRPPAVNPPNKNQPAQPPAVNPGDPKGRQQQSHTVAPPGRGQSPQPLKVDPARGKQKVKQSQNVPPPKKVDLPQPKGKKEDKSKQREK